MYSINNLSHQFKVTANILGHKYDWNNTPTALMGIVTEASEAMEFWRQGDQIKFGEALADIFIRTGHLSSELNIDIYKEIMKKHTSNMLLTEKLDPEFMQQLSTKKMIEAKIGDYYPIDSEQCYICKHDHCLDECKGFVNL